MQQTRALSAPTPDNDVHLVWHKFWYKFKDQRGRYKWKGYDLMQRVKRWAKRWPTQVFHVPCDDSYHASSDLWLIEHASFNSYMGTTMLFIPQCTGEDPIEIFLYPGHRKALLKTLIGLGDKRRSK